MSEETDEFLLELTPGDDCIFSDYEDQEEPDQIKNGLHPLQEKNDEADDCSIANRMYESYEVSFAENVEEDTDELRNSPNNSFVSDKIVIKSLDAQKRKMRLEEMAQRKRPVKQYQTSLQIKSKTERISRNMESRKNVKVKKSRYEGDLQNIWQIRLPPEEDSELWSTDNPPDPSHIHYALYIKSQLQNNPIEVPDSDNTPSVASTPECLETIFCELENDLVNVNGLYERKPLHNTPVMPQSNIQNIAEFPHQSHRTILSDNLTSNSNQIEKVKPFSKTPDNQSPIISTKNETKARTVPVYDSGISEHLIDNAFDKENFNKDGICIIKPKFENSVKLLDRFRKSYGFKLSLNYRVSFINEELTRFTCILDTCSILTCTGIIQKMLKLPTISVILPEFVLCEIQNLIKEKMFMDPLLLDLVNDIESLAIFEQDESDCVESKNLVLRAEYFISAAQKFSKCHVVSEDCTVRKLANERKIKVAEKTCLEKLTRREQFYQEVPKMNYMAVFIEFRGQIRDLLESVFISEFENFFKDDWEKVVKIKPAKNQKTYWNLNSLLQLYNLHFEAVFSEHFQGKGKSLQSTLMSLNDILNSNIEIKEKIKKLITVSFALCREVGKRGELPISSWLKESSIQTASHLKRFSEKLALLNQDPEEQDD